jgi:hypothetical protein
MSRPLPKRISLKESLTSEEVSQAWEYLVSLPEPTWYNPEPEFPPPPEHLKHLTDSDWHLLDNLLARELHLKERSPLQ